MKHDRIECNPKVMVGKPVIRATRIAVELILRLLAKGHTVRVWNRTASRCAPLVEKGEIPFISIAGGVVVIEPVKKWLFKTPHKLRYVRYDFGHNYNQTSREAVYTWFNQQMRNPNDPNAVKEVAYKKELDQDLRVWPDGKLPADALTEPQLLEVLDLAIQKV